LNILKLEKRVKQIYTFLVVQDCGKL